MDVDDALGEFEKPEASLAALRIGHDENDAVLRDQPALARDGIMIAHLSFRGQCDTLESFVLHEKVAAQPSREIPTLFGVERNIQYRRRLETQRHSQLLHALQEGGVKVFL